MSFSRSAQRAFLPAAGGVVATALSWSASDVTASRLSSRAGKIVLQSLQQQAQQSAMMFTRPTTHFRSFAHEAAKNTGKRTATTDASFLSDASNKATSTTTASSSSSSFSLMAWYEKHLQERPVITKMITGSFLWGIGDAVAQLVPPIASGQSIGEYDVPRTSRAVIFGCVLHAPASHLHFNFLEWLTTRVGVTGSIGIPVFKAFMEQFVYWSWISNSLYHGAMGAMQGQTPTQVYHRIADVLWETQKAQWAFWIPVQLLNFRYVPVRHQLNVVLLTSIVWTALLSAWYPPQKAVEASAADNAKLNGAENNQDTETAPAEAEQK